MCIAQPEKHKFFSPSKVTGLTCGALGVCPSALNATSPATPQINLFLRVMRRREDGYHDLASLFHVSKAGCLGGAQECTLDSFLGTFS